MVVQNAVAGKTLSPSARIWIAVIWCCKMLLLAKHCHQVGRTEGMKVVKYTQKTSSHEMFLCGIGGERGAKYFNGGWSGLESQW